MKLTDVVEKTQLREGIPEFAPGDTVKVHVRVVEEPYLSRTHGDAYREYASRVGRFVPGVGRWGSGRDAAPRGHGGGDRVAV